MIVHWLFLAEIVAAVPNRPPILTYDRDPFVKNAMAICGEPYEIECIHELFENFGKLTAAWDSPATTAADRALMLDVIAASAQNGHTNWIVARQQYFVQRQASMYSDGRAPPTSAPPATRRPHTSTTRCTAFVSKNGRSASSRCTTSEY